MECARGWELQDCHATMPLPLRLSIFLRFAAGRALAHKHIRRSHLMHTRTDRSLILAVVVSILAVAMPALGQPGQAVAAQQVSACIFSYAVMHFMQLRA